MSAQDPDNAWHRQTAARSNNAAWTLLEQVDLSDPDKAALVTAAATARHHWYLVGDDGAKAHADLLLGWAMARAGSGGTALNLTKTALDYFETSGAEDWELAFAHAARAAAFWAAEDGEKCRLSCASAEGFGSKLTGDDATYFHAAFRTIDPAARGAS